METQTSTSSRKRKADALEAAGDAESPSGRKLKVATAATPSAHLPASCLAAILDFMEYAEVRRCLLAGKIMAVDAARHVEVLNIMNESELVPSAARRFANVTEVNILSLVTTNEGGHEDILSVDTATRSVPFLILFPKLKRAFLGGIYRAGDEWSKITYAHNYCIEPKDHLSVFRGLVDHLCGAFRSRSLSPSLHLEGVFEREQVKCHKDEDGHRCWHCWSIVTSFPLDLVLERIPKSYGSGLCLKYSERIDALASRHDNPLRFQPQAAIKYLLTMVKEMFKDHYIDSVGESRGGFDDVKKSFIQRIESQGANIHNNSAARYMHCQFFYLAVEDIEALKKISAAIGPPVLRSIPRREVPSIVYSRVLVRETFEGLVQLGFDLASKDFVLIDPLNEDALREYHDQF